MESVAALTLVNVSAAMFAVGGLSPQQNVDLLLTYTS